MSLFWNDEYVRTVHAFNGQEPKDAETEQTCLDQWQRDPTVFRQKVDETAEALNRHAIRWAWSVLVERLARTQRERTETATVDQDRGKAIRHAEQWITTAGLYLTETQLIDELFGEPQLTPPLEWLEQLERETRSRTGRPAYDQLLQAAITETRQHGQQPIEGTGGRLHQHDTPAIRQQMLDHWHAQQPRAEQADAAALAYQTRPFAHWNDRRPEREPVAVAADEELI